MALPGDLNSRQHQAHLELGSSVANRVGIFDSSGSQIDSFGGGTQYTEGDVDATITGNALLMEVAANTLQPVQGTVADGLLVNLGTNNDVTIGANSGVDIGDVDVTSVIPGTGATNLGKAMDSVVGATDTGVGILAKHVEDQVHTTVAVGDYELLSTDSLGSLHVNAEAHHIFDTFNAVGTWTALSNDTINLATTKKHTSGTDALTFDKANGAADTIFAGFQKTLSSVDLGSVSPHDLLQGTFYIPDLTNVAYAFLRLGTDASNYNEWRLPDTALTAAVFETGALSIGDADYTGITGDGWNPAAITYIAVGVAFDAETNTLAGIVFDEISYHTNQHTSTILGAEVTSEVSTPNVNVSKIGGSPTDKNSGNASNGSQRVVLATDDVNMSAIKTAVEIIDNAISGSEMQVDVVAPLPAGTNNIGEVNLGAVDNAVLDAIAASVAAIDTDTSTIITNTGATTTALQIMDDWDNAASDGASVSGDTAHDAADAGEPMKIGGKALAFDGTPPGTDVAENDRVNAIFTVEGRQFVEPAHPNFWSTSVDYASAQTNATVKAAPGASLKLYITDIYCSNGATAGNITLLDGSGGSVKWESYPAINGGGVFTPRHPIALTANTLLAITSTTVTTHSLTICGYTAA